jgi:MoaA/NifB/PqqE/SkfB family radical SAM enzyme
MRLRRLARITRDQLRNYYNHQYRFVPTNLCIETTTLCNAGCWYCARFKSELLGPHMDFELFKAIIDASADFITENVMPYSRGEPLMYPHIIQAIEYITDAGLRSKMYSNGSLLTEHMSRRLIDAGIKELSFSIDTNNGQEFEDIRKIPWSRVLGNIERLVEVRDELGADVFVVVRSTVGPFNIDRIAEIRDFWLERVDEIRLMPLLPMPDKEVLEAKPVTEMQPYECMQAYGALNIRLDGSIPFCCNDWHDCYVVGQIDKSVTKRKILDIYNNKQMARWRDALEFGKGAPTLCIYCQSNRRSVDMWQRLEGLGVCQSALVRQAEVE